MLLSLLRGRLQRGEGVAAAEPARWQCGAGRLGSPAPVAERRVRQQGTDGNAEGGGGHEEDNPASSCEGGGGRDG
eukprot:4995513-Pleurochrysis_carterae.AAC.1